MDAIARLIHSRLSAASDHMGTLAAGYLDHAQHSSGPALSLTSLDSPPPSPAAVAVLGASLLAPGSAGWGVGVGGGASFSSWGLQQCGDAVSMVPFTRWDAEAAGLSAAGAEDGLAPRWASDSSRFTRELSPSRQRLRMGNARVCLKACFCKLLTNGHSSWQSSPLWTSTGYAVEGLNYATLPPCRFGAFIQGAELFDAAAFGVNAREASLMDPHQRLLLHAFAEASSGSVAATAARADGSAWGVYVGVSALDYGKLAMRWVQEGVPGGVAACCSSAHAGLPDEACAGVRCRVSHVTALRVICMSISYDQVGVKAPLALQSVALSCSNCSTLVTPDHTRVGSHLPSQRSVPPVT